MATTERTSDGPKKVFGYIPADPRPETVLPAISWFTLCEMAPNELPSSDTTIDEEDLVEEQKKGGRGEDERGGDPETEVLRKPVKLLAEREKKIGGRRRSEAGQSPEWSGPARRAAAKASQKSAHAHRGQAYMAVNAMASFCYQRSYRDLGPAGLLLFYGEWPACMLDEARV
ncbi:hypothetical protein B0H19DRAFT_1233286 [Mycena capillaripes]|nr:hypothetical protein B0H19DRAFT_1233286 [Mycena capillaripes]